MHVQRRGTPLFVSFASSSHVEIASQLADLHRHRLLCQPSAASLSRDEQFDALVQDVARVMHELPSGLAEARFKKKQQTQA